MRTTRTARYARYAGHARRLVLFGIVVAGLALATPRSAAAQTFFTPYAGVAAGDDAVDTPFTFGASVMWVDTAGLEIDAAYTPDFFGESTAFTLVDSSNVTSLMANLVIAPGRGPLRPYLVAGGGLLRARVTSGSAFFDDLSANSFGVDAGGGLLIRAGDHVGLRGDVRYLRSLQDQGDEDGATIAIGRFGFWRATLGVTFGF
ncbi:MAG: outer membrane beta-barrel protein [Vicinamibacterales bacterium]